MAEIQFSVRGMSCSGCAASIERQLSGMPGVRSASVDLATETAHVVYDESSIGPEALEGAIEDLGFDVVYNISKETGGM